MTSLFRSCCACSVVLQALIVTLCLGKSRCVSRNRRFESMRMAMRCLPSSRSKAGAGGGLGGLADVGCDGGCEEGGGTSAVLGRGGKRLEVWC